MDYTHVIGMIGEVVPGGVSEVTGLVPRGPAPADDEPRERGMATHSYDLVIVGAGSGHILPGEEFAGWRRCG